MKNKNRKHPNPAPVRVGNVNPHPTLVRAHLDELHQDEHWRAWMAEVGEDLSADEGAYILQTRHGLLVDGKRPTVRTYQLLLRHHRSFVDGEPTVDSWEWLYQALMSCEAEVAHG